MHIQKVHSLSESIAFPFQTEVRSKSMVLSEFGAEGCSAGWRRNDKEDYTVTMLNKYVRQ